MALSDKKLDKIHAALGNETIQELDALHDNALALKVVQAGHAIKSVQDELDANPKYQEIKQSKNDLEQSLKEVKKRQNAIIQYSLHLLEDRGADISPEDTIDE